MRQFLLRRIVRAFVTLWGIVTIVFVTMRLSGDPVPLMLPPDAPPPRWTVSAPIWASIGRSTISTWSYVGNVLHGDLGRSIHMRQPAIQIAAERLPATFELALTAFVLAVVVAIPAGLISAARRNSLLDNVAMTLALIGQSAPTFYIGIMLILVLGLQLGWFPISGRGQGSWLVPADWRDMLRHVILPAITLGAFAMASIARLTRSAVLDVLSQDFIRTARAKGLNESSVLLRHTLKNAAIPIVTIVGLQFGTLLGRGRRHRDGVCVAGHRATGDPVNLQSRLPGRAVGGAAGVDVVRAGELPGRSGVRLARPAYSLRMTQQVRPLLLMFLDGEDSPHPPTPSLASVQGRTVLSERPPHAGVQDTGQLSCHPEQA